MDLKAVAASLEEHAEELGWDQPPMLLALTDEGLVVIAGLTSTDQLAAVPPINAEAVAFVSEGWTYPRELMKQVRDQLTLEALNRRLPPSEHPNRVEVRTATVVGHGEQPQVVVRERGKAPDVRGYTQLGGRVVHELTRILGDPDARPRTFSED